MRESYRELDPSMPIPARRPLLWESAADLRRVSLLFAAIIIVQVVALMALVGSVMRLSERQPAVLQEDAGYVMYRTTEVYRLRKDIILTYVRSVLTSLLEVSPGHYNNLNLKDFVASDLLEKVADKAITQGGRRLEANDRQMWDLYDVRRYLDQDYPNLIPIAARGERTVYYEETDAGGSVLPRLRTELMAIVLYLRQQPPTPENPYGLFVVAMKFPDNQIQSDNVWKTTVELEGTNDAGGKSILPPRRHK